MSVRIDSYSLRLGLIAAALALVLVLLIVAVNWLTRPASPPPAPIDEEPVVEAPATPDPTAPSDAVEQDDRVGIQLFLIDSQNRALVSSFRRVDGATLAARARMALELLIGTNGSPLPSGTIVHEVFVSPAGVAFVDFGANLPQLMQQGSLAELHAVFGVVGTLTSIPGIVAVQFLVDHRPIDTLTGHVDLEGPVEPMRGWTF